jgi:hypothetical protein
MAMTTGVPNGFAPAHLTRVGVSLLGPLRQALLTWISEFSTGRLSMSVSILRPKLALNPERSKKNKRLSERPY